MSTNHVIEQGEHLSHLAAQYGFRDYLTIWDHPNNAALKDKRQNPNVLFPGDSVFIPDKEKKSVSRPTGDNAEEKHGTGIVEFPNDEFQDGSIILRHGRNSVAEAIFNVSAV
jgi:hypothetical protein